MKSEEIVFDIFEYPEFVKKGTLKPIIKKTAEIWGTGRGGKSSNSFIIDNLKIGIVKTTDLFDLKEAYNMKDIFDGIRVIVNDRVVKTFPNESKLGRNDYQIIGEICSEDLKRFEKSSHDGFRQAEPTLRDKIRSLTMDLKIAFNKEVGGLKTLGGKDTLTEDILNFLEEVGLGDIVDIMADEGKIEEKDSDLEEIGIKEIEPPEGHYIKRIYWTPEFIRDQTTNFEIKVDIQNISDEELEGLLLTYSVFDSINNIAIGDLEPKEVQTISIPSIDISSKPTYQHKRGKYKISLELKDKINKRIDLRTKSFSFNKILEKIELEGAKRKNILRGQPFRVNIQTNFSGVPFPVTLEFKRKHETDTDWLVLSHSKLKSFTSLPSQIYPTSVKNKEKRGMYEYALSIIKDKDIIETKKISVYVEKILKSIQIKGEENNPIVVLKNPYSDKMTGKLKIGLTAINETRKDYEFNLKIKDGQTLNYSIEDIKFDQLSKKDFTITASWKFNEPVDKALPEMDELLIKTIILDEKPDKERKSLKIKYHPDPQDDMIAHFVPDEKTIYINVLHQLFERLDTPEGLDKEIWYKGLGILLYYCFQDRLEGRDKKWWDFEAKFHELNKKYSKKKE